MSFDERWAGQQEKNRLGSERYKAVERFLRASTPGLITAWQNDAQRDFGANLAIVNDLADTLKASFPFYTGYGLDYGGGIRDENNNSVDLYEYSIDPATFERSLPRYGFSFQYTFTNPSNGLEIGAKLNDGRDFKYIEWRMTEEIPEEDKTVTTLRLERVPNPNRGLILLNRFGRDKSRLILKINEEHHTDPYTNAHSWGDLTSFPRSTFTQTIDVYKDLPPQSGSHTFERDAKYFSDMIEKFKSA